MESETLTMAITWRDVAVYALAFAGSGLALFVTVAYGFAKWVVNRVLAGQRETNERLDKMGERLDKMDEHFNTRLLGLDRRVTRVEAKIGVATPMPTHDDNLLG